MNSWVIFVDSGLFAGIEFVKDKKTKATVRPEIQIERAHRKPCV